jgi:DNA-binding IclR family transcriptional regulator
MARPSLSASRAIDIVNFLARHPQQSFTLSELVRRLGINVASAHAILAVLEEAEYVMRDDTLRTYGLGPMLVPLGQAALLRHESIGLARDQLRELAGELDLTGLVVGATASEMVILDEVPASANRTPSIGQRIRMVPPMGGVFLAWEARDRVDEWLTSSSSGLSRGATQQLRALLDAIRARGFAVGLETSARHGMRRALRDLQEDPGSPSAKGRLRKNVTLLGDIATVVVDLVADHEYDLAHVAAPVFGPTGVVDLSLYLVGFRRPYATGEVERLGDRLRAVATSVTRASGGELPGGRARAIGAPGAVQMIW